MNISGKVAIISFCVLEIGVGVVAAYRIHQQKSQVLGSVIDTSRNVNAGTDKLTYYYEPVANSIEVDRTPWVHGQATFTYNLDTLNDRFNYPLVASPSTYRIIALGDSFTFGDHVNTKDAWTEQLEDLLNAKQPCANYTKYEVLNLGLRGFDIQNEVERFRVRGKKYNPDLVIWLLVENDFSQVRELMMKKKLEVHDKEVADHTVNEDDPWDIPDKVALADMNARYPKSQIYAMQDKFMSEFNALYSGSLIFATLKGTELADQDHVRKWASNRPDTAYLNLLPNVFKDPALHVLDWHPSPLGHAKIAEYLYNNLIVDRALRCKAW